MLALLNWFHAMGVDAALDDVPQDWLARGPLPPGAGFAWPGRDEVSSAIPSLSSSERGRGLGVSWSRRIDVTAGQNRQRPRRDREPSRR